MSMHADHRNGTEVTRELRGSVLAWSAALALIGVAAACDVAGREAAARGEAVEAARAGSEVEPAIAGGAGAAQSGEADASSPRTAEGDADRIASASSSESLAGPPTGLVPPAPGEERLEGVVAEHLPAGGYTYLHVELEGQAPRWVVTMRRDVGTGDRVRVDNLGSRHGFYSRRLDRRFAELVFGVVEVVGASPR